MDDVKKILRDFRDIAPDYDPSPDALLNEEDDRVRRVKEIVANRLEPWERTVILLYADCASLRQIGRRLGISQSSAHRIVGEIQEKVLAAYYEMTAKELNEQIRTQR